jgi:hypothetical protein
MHENRAGSGEVEADARGYRSGWAMRSGGMKRSMNIIVHRREARREMGYIIISYSSNHITFFRNRGTSYTPGCLRGSKLLLSVAALLLGVPAELLSRVSGDGTDDGVYRSSMYNTISTNVFEIAKE